MGERSGWVGHEENENMDDADGSLTMKKDGSLTMKKDGLKLKTLSMYVQRIDLNNFEWVILI
jgi:hypothetical protein